MKPHLVLTLFTVDTGRNSLHHTHKIESACITSEEMLLTRS